MRSFCSILVLVSVIAAKEVFRRNGDVNVAVILRDGCNGSAALTEREQEIVNSAIWIAHQINQSEILPEISFGLSMYKVCNEDEEYETIFELFRKRNEESLIGVVTSTKSPTKIKQFSETLGLRVKESVRCTSPLVKASVALLGALNWTESVAVIAPDKATMEAFFKISHKQQICVSDYFLYDSIFSCRSKKPSKNMSSEYTVIFGKRDFLSTFINNYEIANAIIVPLDDSVLNVLPENSYMISSTRSLHKEEEEMYTPNPQLFEIATPLVTFAQTLRHLNCNSSNYKSCLKNHREIPEILLEPIHIADLLKIATSSINYFIYKSENSSLETKAFVYNIFSQNLTRSSFFTLEDTSRLVCQPEKNCREKCKNSEILNRINFISEDYIVRIRSESWVFGFLSLSLLGVLLCIAIFIFLLVSICRRNVLEGNPVLTLLLLITVMLMYGSILPLSLEGSKKAKESVCLARAFATTLSFSASFSLILSRSILLATASKEIGFMSHVAGPVQSFLCLFIFGVQAALSLQVINRCEDLFKGSSLIYLLSYNAMLLLLLLCLSPLTVKSQRNYKEGKYFTLAVIAISFLWCLWLPSYALFDAQYKDSVLCFGLVSTASALLGTIFIPRTYVMTIAAARDKMTSALPSLAATSSAIDIYRAGTQPVYDCVNVAAINAVTVARAGVTPIQRPDLYSCPNLPEDDFDMRCESPVTDDKVTRF